MLSMWYNDLWDSLFMQPVVLKDIVIPTGYLMLMSSTPQVGTYLPLEVAQCNGGLVDRPF